MPTNKKKQKTKASTTASPIEELLGTSLLVGKSIDEKEYPRKSTKDIFREKQFVLLYFSCKSYHCEKFVPDLKEFYAKYGETGKFEVVYVSSDKTLRDFDDNFTTMPWVAIPNDDDGYHCKKNLAEKLKIHKVPVVVLLEVSTGLFVTNKVHLQVRKMAQDKFSQASALSVLVEWKETKPVPIEEGAQDAQIDSLWYTLLRNPAWIILLLYAYKWYFKSSKKQEVGLDEGEF